MNETNKLINDNNSSKSSFFNEKFNENFLTFFEISIPINKLLYYRIKLGFFFLILIHLIFGVIDYYQIEYENKNMCMEKDPIWMFDDRLEVERHIVCRSANASHFC